MSDLLSTSQIPSGIIFYFPKGPDDEIVTDYRTGKRTELGPNIVEIYGENPVSIRRYFEEGGVGEDQSDPTEE